MTTDKSPARLLNEMIGGLAQSTGGCSQLLHMRQDPRWMMMRKVIESASDVCKQHATISAQKLNGFKKL